MKTTEVRTIPNTDRQSTPDMFAIQKFHSNNKCMSELTIGDDMISRLVPRKLQLLLSSSRVNCATRASVM